MSASRYLSRISLLPPKKIPIFNFHFSFFRTFVNSKIDKNEQKHKTKTCPGKGQSEIGISNSGLIERTA